MQIPAINIFIGGEALQKRRDESPLKKALLRKKETDESMLEEMKKIKDSVKRIPYSGSFHAGGG